MRLREAEFALLGPRFGTRSATALDRLSQLLRVDVVTPDHFGSGEVAGPTLVGDLADERIAQEVVSARPDVIFHLAAVVSGEAEPDLEKGYRVNVTRVGVCSKRSVGRACAGRRASFSARRSRCSVHRSRM